MRNRIVQPTRTSIVALAVLCGFTLAALPAAAQGTPEQRAACQGDAQRLCGQYIPDVQRITDCMIKMRRYVSPRCRATMQPPGRKRRG
jgi:type II secretory pathway component PulL